MAQYETESRLTNVRRVPIICCSAPCIRTSIGGSLPDNTMHVHEHELKRGEGHPLWVILFIVLHHLAALLTALQTPCCIHAGVCAGWRTKFSCYLLPVSLPLSLDRGAQRKVQSAFAHQAIIPPHRKLQAPSHGFARCTAPHHQAFCDIGKHLCIKERLCSRH